MSDALDREALTGVGWSSAAKWTTQIFAWGSTILVARILAPADYGLLAMATVFMGVVRMLSEFGIGSAVITLRELPEQVLGQLNALAIWLGVAGTLLTLACAPALGAFFKAPALPPVLMVVGTTFFISSWQTVPASLLRREMRFKTLAIIDLTRGLVVPVVTLVGAMAGLRYWALALGSVSEAILTTGLTLYHVRVKPVTPRLEAIRSALSFSRDILVSRIAWIIYQDGDFAVAGRRLGEAAVGAYSLAWTLANSPIEKVTMILSDVTPSLFSSAQHDQAALRRYFLNLTELLCLATFPASVGLALVSHDLVPVVLGDDWVDAAGPLAALALYAGARSVTSLFGHLFVATRQTSFAMWSSLLLAGLLLTGFVVGSTWGTVGIAAAWLVVHPAFSVYAFTRVKSALNVSGFAYLKVLRLGMDGSVAMAMVLLGLQTTSFWIGLGSGIRLPLSIAVGAAVFTVVTLALHRRRLVEIVAWLKRVRAG